jgi:aldose 1-epimerase
MVSSAFTLLLAAASALVSAQNASSPYPPFSGNPFQKYNLQAKGIKATFIPYGARLTNLWVHDRNGEWQDVAVGYDDPEQYLTDSETNHTYFGCVVGRYANR